MFNSPEDEINTSLVPNSRVRESRSVVPGVYEAGVVGKSRQGVIRGKG